MNHLKPPLEKHCIVMKNIGKHNFGMCFSVTLFNYNNFLINFKQKETRSKVNSSKSITKKTNDFLFSRIIEKIVT